VLKCLHSLILELVQRPIIGYFSNRRKKKLSKAKGAFQMASKRKPAGPGRTSLLLSKANKYWLVLYTWPVRTPGEREKPETKRPFFGRSLCPHLPALHLSGLRP